MSPSLKRPRLTLPQKAALKAYNFAVQQEDRYLGSVFAHQHSRQAQTHEAKVKAAYDACKRLGMDHTHGL